jgi:hypothetical protein
MKKLLSSMLVMSILFSCQKNDTQKAAAIVNRIDSTYNKIADIQLEQIQIHNKAFENPKLTEVIKGFENLSPIEKGNKIGDIVARKTGEFQPCDQHIPRKTGDIFIHEEQPDIIMKSNDKSFDKAIRYNDMTVEKVKALQSHFQDLDKSTLGAIAFYEKLSTEDKLKMFSVGSDLIPVPDYQRFVGRELLLAYNLKKLNLYRDLNRYVTRRMYINEFPQGFKNKLNEIKIERGDSKEFDLPFVKY